MLSATLRYLEEYSKTFDIEKYFDTMNNSKIKIKNEEDIEGFFKLLMEATFHSIKKFKDLSPKYDVNEQYERLKNDDYAKREFVRTYGIMSAIDNWLDYKQIYKFDVDALDTLMSSDLKDLTYEELKALKMPYDCFAIENKLPYDNDFSIESVILRREIKAKSVVITFLGFGADMNKCVLFEMKIDNEHTLLDEIKRNELSEAKEYTIKGVLNLLMYLCQPKIEVIRKHVDKGEKEEKKKSVKHFYKINYEENKVGVRLGNAVRNYKIVYDEHVKTHKGIGTKCPHLRRGHYQGYWTGKGRTTLVTKYIEPIFVLGGNKDAVIHKVKGEKNE